MSSLARLAGIFFTAFTIVSSNSASALERETESALRRVIPTLQSGTPDYDSMEATLRVAVRQQIARIAPQLSALGAVQTIRFEGEEQGADVYEVIFERGATVWRIALSPDRRLSILYFQQASY